jgi:hypothetical protein
LVLTPKSHQSAQIEHGWKGLPCCRQVGIMHLLGQPAWLPVSQWRPTSTSNSSQLLEPNSSNAFDILAARAAVFFSSNFLCGIARRENVDTIMRH